MVGTAPSLFRQRSPAWVRLLVFLLLSLSLMVTDANWRGLDVMRQYMSLALSPFQYAMLLPRDGARQVADWLDTAARIRKEGEAEQQREIELAQLATRATRLAEENRQLRRLLGVREQSEGLPPVLVELLYESRTQFEQRLIINKGREAGVRPGNPLIDQKGLVGQVVRSGSYTAEVALVTDSAISVPIQVLRNGLRAIAFPAPAPGKLELRYVPVDADIVVGDILVTSGLGGWFPPGVIVSRVETVEPDPVSGYARVISQPVAGLDQYRHYLVLPTTGIDPTTIDPDYVPASELPGDEPAAGGVSPADAATPAADSAAATQGATP